MSDKFIVLSASYYYADFESQGTRVTGDTQFKCSFIYESEDLHDFDRISDTILCYRGIDKAPNWLDIRTGKILIYRRVLVCHAKGYTDRFSRLCTIHADMSGANRKRIIGPNGPYYLQTFEVILLFGLVETKAQLCWMENVSTLLMLRLLQRDLIRRCCRELKSGKY